MHNSKHLTIRPSTDLINELDEAMKHGQAEKQMHGTSAKERVIRTLELGREVFFESIAQRSYRGAANELKTQPAEARRARHIYKAWSTGRLKFDWSGPVMLEAVEAVLGMRDRTGHFIDAFADEQMPGGEA